MATTTSGTSPAGTGMPVMLFGQLSSRESLRDLIATISAHSSKYYHLGFGKGASRSNLASANETPDWRIFQTMAEEMIAIARACIVPDPEFMPAVKGASMPLISQLPTNQPILTGHY